ncbi:MAG: hypothetical protein ABI644_02295, partial [Arenimonas sp.]
KMSNVIQFLESMGKDASLANMSPEEYSAAVKASGVDDVAKLALLNRDQGALNDSIGAYKKMMMLLVPAEDDDQGAEKDSDKESDKDGDNDQDEKSSVN